MGSKGIALVLMVILINVNCDTKIDEHPNWSLIPNDLCGTTVYQNVHGRIIGGKEAKVGQFPWIVRLGYFASYLDEPSFNCAGTLINEYFVLTAGHCGDENNIARVGEYDANNEVDCDEEKEHCSKYQDIKIAEYVFNDYERSTSYNDLCLIRLAEAAKFNDYVKPACLPRGEILEADLTGKRVQVAGWGYTDSKTDTVATTLMYVTMPVITRENCDEIYNHKLIERQLCVGYKSGKDSCNGDSGGGVTKLMQLGEESRYYLVAIVSYGKKDCGEGPAVYTAVAKYMERILDNISEPQSTKNSRIMPRIFF